MRRPGWSLTGFTVAWVATVVAGGLAPPGTPRRRAAWAVAPPAVPLAVLIGVIIQPASYSRLVSLTSISLGFGSFMAAVTAGVVWYVMRGRLLPTVLGSWLAWGTIVFLSGRDAIGL